MKMTCQRANRLFKLSRICWFPNNPPNKDFVTTEIRKTFTDTDIKMCLDNQHNIMTDLQIRIKRMEDRLNNVPRYFMHVFWVCLLIWVIHKNGKR